MYLNVVPNSSGMSGLGARRGLRLVRRRGIGQNTLASNVPAFCASLNPIDVSAYPACVAVGPAAIAQAAVSIPSSSINISNLMAANAPPVYLTSFTASSDPNVYSSSSYQNAQLVASIVSQVNDQNGRLYAQYQNTLSNWQAQGAQGAPPAIPNYVTPAQYLASNPSVNASGLISTAPPGTPIPQSGYDAGSAPVYSQPQLQPAYTPPAITTIVQSQPISQPLGGPSATGTSPTPVNTTTNGQSNPLAFATDQVSVLGSSFPVWELAAGGLVVAFLLLRKFL